MRTAGAPAPERRSTRPRHRRARLAGGGGRPTAAGTRARPPPGGAPPPGASSGAGSSGIAAAKALHERGVSFACFEASDRVGGNWVFGNRNGMSSAYRSLHINTSRNRMEYSDFPMPKSYPDFPHHTQIAQYFND